MKKIITLVVVLVLQVVAFIPISMTNVSVSAESLENNCNNEVHYHEQDEEYLQSSLAIQPFYVVSCPQGRKHQMVGRGTGVVYSGSLQKPGTRLIYGSVNQCKNCYLLLFSEGNPRISGILGKYLLYNANGPQSNYGVVCYAGTSKLDTFKGLLASDPFWSGFEFINGQ